MHPLIEGSSSSAADYIESRQRTQIEGTSDAESTERTQWPNNSIFHAPAHIRSGKESNFEPKLVSIGPYYHGKENLKRMENLKLRCFTELRQKQVFGMQNHPRPSEAGILHRRNQSIYNVPVEPSVNGKRGIDDVPLKPIYNEPVEPSVNGKRGIDDVPLKQFLDWGRKAYTYYNETDHELHARLDRLLYYRSHIYYDGPEYKHYESYEQAFIEYFVRMLILDSCFIIRTIFSLSQQVHESMSFLDVDIKDVRSDLLLLENQIPLFFIKEVYEWFFPRMPGQKFPPFNIFLEPFIWLDMPWIINHDAMSSEAIHLLDLYWRCSLSPRIYIKFSELDKDLSEREGDLSEQIEEERSHSIEQERHFSEQEQPSWVEIHLSNNAPMEIANATELQKMSGIKFETFKDKGHLDVTFSNGIMRMPRLKIDTRQTTLLVNLIAFENCILPSMRIISCYMKLMDALINSEKDVNLLQKCGVIYNTLSSHEMAATFFNDIGNFCFIDYSTNQFSGLYKDVQEYYDSSWHRRWASLRQNYFSSPWAGISVVAAVTLLILSALQTFYSVYGYYKPKK